VGVGKQWEGGMNNFYTFASDSPFLTFFIAYLILETCCVAFKAMGGKYKNCKGSDDD